MSVHGSQACSHISFFGQDMVAVWCTPPPLPQPPPLLCLAVIMLKHSGMLPASRVQPLPPSCFALPAMLMLVYTA